MRLSCQECQMEFDAELLLEVEAICPGCGHAIRADGGPPDGTTVQERTEAGARDDTIVWSGRDELRNGSRVNGLPAKIGRYSVRSQLGGGGFGLVYLAYDEPLDRLVAIKTFRKERYTSLELERILDEARITAGLKHPLIVSVFDFGQTEDGSSFLVMEYIEGRSLASLIDSEPIAPARAAALLIDIADAVHHAHEQGFIHRDLKPANIFLDANDRAHVGDFGLAAHEDRLRRLAVETSGTPAYMAPEQVRGENHRIDKRTDVWSLGVILYELLVGKRPFTGASDRSRLFGDILYRDARPPRHVDQGIPLRLEQICLKCLSKRMTERYATAAEFAEDLRHWRDSRDQPHAEAQSSRFVPKSLHAFDADDSDFFLELLPGPRDRDGLPESVRFWKSRIEETDADRTFSVGMLFGPSGSGKTSLLKAGLMPRLAHPRLVVAYVEATPDATESKLLHRLHVLCPDLDRRLSLTEALARLREGDDQAPGRKVLIVLDQFEQWLHAKRTEGDRALVQALRHCDGASVQCLVLVRDDFGMLAAQFMDELEVPIVQGFNFAAVDLFDRKHARKVLMAFGRAFGQLPDDPDAMRPEQERFLDEAVEGLAEDGSILCVRLTLFAEVVKAKPWVPLTLKEVGGMGGIGSTFLEAVLGDNATNPEYRRHQQAARAVLKALLPEPGSAIKAHKRSWLDLLNVSGYKGRPDDFDQLLRILDAELRLVTPSDPVEPGEAGTESSSSASPVGRYQLTHDFLVQALHRWLGRKQRETWRGRAELCLEERSAQWRRSRQDRFLPSLPEYLAIEFGVPWGQRKSAERLLMRSARLHHGLRWGGALAALLLVVAGVRGYILAIRANAARDRAATLVSAVLTAPPDAVPYTIDNLRPLAGIAKPLLRDRLRGAEGDPRSRLHAAFALAASGDVERSFLVESIAEAPSAECRNLVAALRPVRLEVREGLRRRVFAETDPDIKMRYAVVLLQLGDPAGAREVLRLREDPRDRSAFIHGYAGWHAEVGALANPLWVVDDEPFRSGICAALGLVPVDSLQASDRAILAEVFSHLYRTYPDGGTHAAAGWALRRWHAALPAIAPSRMPVSPRNWFVNEHGLTMIGLPPGRFSMDEPSKMQPRPVKLTRPFFMSDREISMALFQEYLNAPGAEVEPRPPSELPDGAVSPGPDYPAQSVSWIDAALFCNWLSRREGRQPCYRRTGVKKVVFKTPSKTETTVELWDCNFRADGYRLPTEAEWEYACRAGTVTPYSFGAVEERLINYGTFSGSHAAPSGDKLPNAWGLFDMHGSVREWCWDWSGAYPVAESVDPQGIALSADRVQRGGSWYDHARACQSGVRNADNPSHRDRLLGFRVVCTAPDGPV